MPDRDLSVAVDTRDPNKPFCEGGIRTCDVCVGSCGIEEWAVEESRRTRSSSAAESREVWHVVSGSDVRELLRRARAGEDPELLYVEWYANATEREDFSD